MNTIDWHMAKKYEKVSYVVPKTLEALGASSRETAQKGDAVWKKAKELFPQLTSEPKPVPENSFFNYLSQLVGEPESRVNCEGPWKGYYLSTVSATIISPPPSAPDTATSSDEPTRKEKEKLVYPFAVEWLKTQGYRCDDTSNFRKLGKWGNPDVTGLLITESFGAWDIEVATIEVKASHADWEYWIFESVAHRRFANRSYFAFAAPEDVLPKLPKELRHYSELYGIGILALVMELKTFQELDSGSLDRELKAQDIWVQELYSAPFHPVPAPNRKRFLQDFLQIKEIGKAVTWGDSLEDNE